MDRDVLSGLVDIKLSTISSKLPLAATLIKK